ncbi:hypothetical protein HK099_006227 [Clydaea vesicula]|uniref:C3H1-type domain-containing protein n=1 Tax=Clydaea vesicula TaxID=447962 RepID=A0AAD5XX35_9FUNG|nr:hypothetical protein HK099_006227 [Clydaea vesicula]
MAICSYFLRGNCRFGSNCKNEHSSSKNSSRSNSPSVLNVHINELKKDLQDERPIWKLSSYHPKPSDLALSPNFQLTSCDFSQEEARYDFLLEKKSTGSIMNYVNNFKVKLDQVNVKIQNLLSGNSETKNIPTSTNAFAALGNISSTTTGNSGAFRQSSSNFVGFGNSNNSFHSAPNAFGQTATTFGANQPVAGFGNFSNNTFGGSNSFASPAFGQGSLATNANSNSGFFGNATQSAPAFGSYSFGNANQTTPAFGSSSFGNVTTQVTPAFGASAFGNQPSSANTTAPTGNSLFGQQSNFTPAQQTTLSSNAPGNISQFNNAGGLSLQAFHSEKPLDSKDEAIYRKNEFEFGNIPETPPTMQLRYLA